MKGRPSGAWRQAADARRPTGPWLTARFLRATAIRLALILAAVGVPLTLFLMTEAARLEDLATIGALVGSLALGSAIGAFIEGSARGRDRREASAVLAFSACSVLGVLLPFQLAAVRSLVRAGELPDLAGVAVPGQGQLIPLAGVTVGSLFAAVTYIRLRPPGAPLWGTTSRAVFYVVIAATLVLCCAVPTLLALAVGLARLADLADGIEARLAWATPTWEASLAESRAALAARVDAGTLSTTRLQAAAYAGHPAARALARVRAPRELGAWVIGLERFGSVAAAHVARAASGLVLGAGEGPHRVAWDALDAWCRCPCAEHVRAVAAARQALEAAADERPPALRSLREALRCVERDRAGGFAARDAREAVRWAALALGEEEQVCVAVQRALAEWALGPAPASPPPPSPSEGPT